MRLRSFAQPPRACGATPGHRPPLILGSRASALGSSARIEEQKVVSSDRGGSIEGASLSPLRAVRLRGGTAFRDQGRARFTASRAWVRLIREVDRQDARRERGWGPPRRQERRRGLVAHRRPMARQGPPRSLSKTTLASSAGPPFLLGVLASWRSSLSRFRWREADCRAGRYLRRLSAPTILR